MVIHANGLGSRGTARGGSGRSGVELGVSENGLDHRLAFSVKLAAGVGLKHAAHERVGAAAAAGPCAVSRA
jgi:hypothetical protein